MKTIYLAKCAAALLAFATAAQAQTTGFARSTASDFVLTVPISIQGDSSRLLEGLSIECVLMRREDGDGVIIGRTSEIIKSASAEFTPNASNGVYISRHLFQIRNDINPDVESAIFGWQCNLYRSTFVDTNKPLYSGNQPDLPITYGTCQMVTGAFSWPEMLEYYSATRQCLNAPQ